MGSSGLGYHMGSKVELDLAPSEDAAVESLGTGSYTVVSVLQALQGTGLTRTPSNQALP